MPTKSSIQDDLQFVAGAVRRRERQSGVPVIFFMWAAIILVGWALPDFAPVYAGWFWVIVGPIGGLLSWWLGSRDAQSSGEVDRELGMRHGLHWLVSGAAFFAVALPFIAGTAGEGYSDIVFGRQMLLVIALAYGLAAVHLERGLAWPAAIMGAGYAVLSIWSPDYLWTTMGVIVATSLVIAGVQARR